MDYCFFQQHDDELLKLINEKGEPFKEFKKVAPFSFIPDWTKIPKGKTLICVIDQSYNHFANRAIVMTSERIFDEFVKDIPRSKRWHIMEKQDVINNSTWNGRDNLPDFYK